MIRILTRLVSETAVYGLSSIIGRFLNYLLVPLYTYYFIPSEYGVVAEFYAYAGFLAVVLVFGLETGYFRFRGDEGTQPIQRAYATAFRTVLCGNGLFALLIMLFHDDLAASLRYPHHSEYILWIAGVLILDSLGALPFARLRVEHRAARFACIKIVEILITVFFNLLFIIWLRRYYAIDHEAWWTRFYDPSLGITYIFIANFLGSVCKLLLLSPQLRIAWLGFDLTLFKELIGYSLPMVIIGLAGVVNEMVDRVLLKFLLPYDTRTNLYLLGIYSACYKLSILMSLFIQAFRYAAEPFFFSYAANQDARQVYAGVLKYFVLFCVFIFLLVTLYLDIFKYFIGPEYRVGLKIVPVLLMANLFLGIYVNLSIWYKLTDHTQLGAWVALGGALVTLVLNFWWIPVYGYVGAAWATLVCYGSMALTSYLLGRRYYPVPYNLQYILGYIGYGLLLFFLQGPLAAYTGWRMPAVGTLLLAMYLMTVTWLEARNNGSHSIKP